MGYSLGRATEVLKREPDEEDIERIFCNREGEAGHHACGWCEEHDRPRFTCLACCLKFNDRKEV